MDFTEREDFFNGNGEFAGGDEPGEAGVGGMEFGGGRGVDPAAEPEAVEGKIFENQQAVRDFQRLAGHGAVGDVGRIRGEGVGEIQGAGAADGTGRAMVTAPLSWK